MPEGLEGPPPVVHVVKQRLNNSQEGGRESVEDKVRNATRTHDIDVDMTQFPDTELVGRGAESIVVGKPGDPERVIAFSLYDVDPVRAKQIFYYHKILALLFPHNFPRFFASFGGDRGRTVRQRITPSETGTVRYPLSGVIQTCHEIGIPIHLDVHRDEAIELGDKNVIIGSDGGEYYVDVVQFDQDSMDGWDEARLVWYMNATDNQENRPRISHYNQQQILRSLRRLRKLSTVQAARARRADGSFSQEQVESKMRTNGLDDDNRKFEPSKEALNLVERKRDNSPHELLKALALGASNTLRKLALKVA